MFIASYFPQIFIQTFQLFYQLRSSVITMDNQAIEADLKTTTTTTPPKQNNPAGNKAESVAVLEKKNINAPIGGVVLL